MSMIEKLMNATQVDTDVLRRLDADGDKFQIFREVDFYFKCPSKEKAELVAGFLEDYQYGKCKLIDESDFFAVQLIIFTPVTQNIILCISGFMTCIAELFDVEMDGWGCVAQNDQAT